MAAYSSKIIVVPEHVGNGLLQDPFCKQVECIGPCNPYPWMQLNIAWPPTTRLKIATRRFGSVRLSRGGHCTAGNHRKSVRY